MTFWKASRIGNRAHSLLPKFVDPWAEITPSALAGPGVSRPTALTLLMAIPARSAACFSATSICFRVTAGPRPTSDGDSSISEMWNVPSSPRSVTLTLVPPRSTPAKKF